MKMMHASLLCALTVFGPTRIPAANALLQDRIVEGTVWEVDYRGQPVAVYVFAPDLWKPYLRALNTVAGNSVLRDAPIDHRHHHGLMYGITVNDVDFWLETPGCGVQKPVQQQRWQPGKNSLCQSQVGFAQQILWTTGTNTSSRAITNAASPNGQVLLIEDRRLTVAVAASGDEVALRWQAEFRAGPAVTSVRLTGANYHGLGLRFRQDLDAAAIHYVGGQPVNTAGTRQDLSRGDWGAVVFQADQPATIAVLGNPANARGAATFFSMKQPFAYLSATQALDQESLVYQAVDRWSLDYVVLLYDGLKTPEFIAKRWAAWRQVLSPP